MGLGMVVGDSTMKRRSEKSTFLMQYIFTMTFINDRRIDRGLDMMVAPLGGFCQGPNGARNGCGRLDNETTLGKMYFSYAIYIYYDIHQ